MSGSKVENNAAYNLLGKQFMFSNPSKSGKIRTLRRNQNITDFEWSQNSSGKWANNSNSAGSIVHPLTQISSQIGNMSISNESNMAPFPKAQVGRPTMMFQPPTKSSISDQMYVAEASINFTNKTKSTPPKLISKPKTNSSPFSVDNDAMRTTEKIFEFLWDAEPQSKGDSAKTSKGVSPNLSYRL